ncbi:MAG TPA: ATP-binding protein [Isosphaeraceae bacterium]|nr:ATP-binding protein [Isosphaeraceae bacterium]
MAQVGVVVAIVAVVVLVLVAAFLLARRAAALAEIARGVAALGKGQPTRPILVRVRGPVGRLARLFDSVAPQLEARIARLEQDRQQLRAVLSGMAEGVIAIDARRRLLFANASADRLFGLDGASVGRLVPELIRSPQVQEAIEATLADPEPYQGEITLASREVLLRAHARVLAVHGTPLPGSPPPGAVLVFHDVTELRRLERMRQDFVANVSHELKTPLASIKAYTETLLDWALHDEDVNVRFLHRIEEQADRLNQLILDLLSLARLESGPEVYEHGPLALAAVIASCVDSHRGRCDSKDLALDLDLGPLDDQTLVRADEEAIRQILDNLIDNAIKYTPEGGTVRVTCRVDGDAIAVEVADSGIGIPRDDLPRVFERFYRVDKARSRELGGTGLGLSIVKHLVQSIGGQIAVSSRVGAGSQFTVTLPRFLAPMPRG